MAYSLELADRIRAALADRDDVTERKMFGGLAFMLGGHMTAVASGQGGLMVRADPSESDELARSTAARPAEMRGRALAGWLRIDEEHVATDEALALWIARSVAVAAALPAK